MQVFLVNCFLPMCDKRLSKLLGGQDGDFALAYL